MIVFGLFVFSIFELIFGLGIYVLIFYLLRILGGISVVFIMSGVIVYVVDIII